MQVGNRALSMEWGPNARLMCIVCPDAVNVCRKTLLNQRFRDGHVVIQARSVLCRAVLCRAVLCCRPTVGRVQVPGPNASTAPLAPISTRKRRVVVEVDPGPDGRGLASVGLRSQYASTKP